MGNPTDFFRDDILHSLSLPLYYFPLSPSSLHETGVGKILKPPKFES